LREGCGVLLTSFYSPSLIYLEKDVFTPPLLFPLSNRVKEGGQLEEELFVSPLSFEKERGWGQSRESEFS